VSHDDSTFAARIVVRLRYRKAPGRITAQYTVIQDEYVNNKPAAGRQMLPDAGSAGLEIGDGQQMA
jgi:hypothetical protein